VTDQMTSRPDTDEGPVQSFRTRRWRACHVLFVAAGWVAFVLLWWRVLDRPGALLDVRVMALMIGIAIGLVGLMTWAWIGHNVALARRRGGRSSVTPLRVPTEDRLGRRLDLEPGAATASYVVVRVDGGVKQFVKGDGASA
jgi:hypothetical protein